MNAYLVDFYSDLDTPYKIYYLFADSFQDVFKKIKESDRKDLLCIKEIPLFQEPETITGPEVGIYYFDIIPSLKFKFPQKTIGVLAETIDLAFSFINSCMDEDSKIIEFSLGEQKLSYYS